MLPKVGDKIRVFDLPSYKTKSKPYLPVEADVVEITEYSMVIVEINGKRFELYEDDGYESVST